jgi:DNA-repair protein XRCC1
LQLERPSVITSVDIGNYGSAFVEVLARNSEWDKDRPYCPLVPMSTLMSPSESREWTNIQGVTMFCTLRNDEPGPDDGEKPMALF